MLVAKFEREGFENRWMAEELSRIDMIVEEIKLGEEGDKFTISIIEMTPKELEALPEFDGW